MVPEVGIEPTWACGPRDFETSGLNCAHLIKKQANSILTTRYIFSHKKSSCSWLVAFAGDFSGSGTVAGTVGGFG